MKQLKKITSLTLLMFLSFGVPFTTVFLGFINARKTTFLTWLLTAIVTTSSLYLAWQLFLHTKTEIKK